MNDTFKLKCQFTLVQSYHLKTKFNNQAIGIVFFYEIDHLHNNARVILSGLI